MSEDLLIRHCSPTLAGIKTGNLFSCACPSRKDLTRDLCRLNKKLVPKGIRVLPLRVRKGRALIYAYRPQCAGERSDRSPRQSLASEIRLCAGKPQWLCGSPHPPAPERGGISP
ncbi:MAG: DUF3793 family protein [Dysosmobacter sp.]